MPKNVTIILDGKKLAQEFQDGATLEELAQKYNCSKTTIRKAIIRQTKVNSLKELRPNIFNKVLKLWESGCSIEEIANKLNIKRNTASIYVSCISRKKKTNTLSVKKKCYRCGMDRGANKRLCDRCLRELARNNTWWDGTAIYT